MLGGVAGLVALGPVVGVVAAGSAAYGACTQGGVVGDALRGTGSLVAKAGSAAKTIEQHTGIASGAAKGVVKGVGWMMTNSNNSNSSSKTTNSQYGI